MTRPRVLLADDHRIVAEGLRSLIEPELELVVSRMAAPCWTQQNSWIPQISDDEGFKPENRCRPGSVCR